MAKTKVKERNSASKPSRIKQNTNQQNTNTMKNENKCFFSISLENGITITGVNPNEVKHFLTDLSQCVTDAIDSGLNDKYKNYKDYLYELKKQLDNAWVTIYNNQNKKG